MIYLFILIELTIIGYLLYQFFFQELKFLYFHLTDKNLLIDQTFKVKMDTIKKYNFICDQNNKIVIKESGKALKYINKSIIQFENNKQCNQFLTEFLFNINE